MVHQIAHSVAVIYLGVIVETAPVTGLFGHLHHPCTQALLSAMLEPEPATVRHQFVLAGDVPRPIAVLIGCRFHTRCPIAQPLFMVVAPAEHKILPDHNVACHPAAPFPIDTGVPTA